MTATSPQADSTPLDAIARRIRACAATPDGIEAPAAILWTDPEGQWLPVKAALLAEMPELLVLGDFDPANRTGPAIWLRCMVERTLEEPAMPADRTPIIYLPRVGRQNLRAGEDCPWALQPLVELMYRGTLWLQKGGREWTLTAFLTSPQGLELDLARGDATKEALARALREVVESPLAQLRGRRLEAEDFDRLLSSDVIRDVLRWMGDPAGTKKRLDQNGWGAFRSRCREELDLDPDVDADVTAGERLGGAKGAWANVWQRFVESPASYGGIADLLRRSRPGGSLPFDREPWPDLNDQDEADVHTALTKLTKLQPWDACDAIAKLESEHGRRRGWVWARMGLSPMAMILEPLSRLAEVVRTSMGGATPEEFAANYVARGWQADVAAWETMAAMPILDESLSTAVVRHLLAQWLEESAQRFQEAVQRSPLPDRDQQTKVEAGEDGCVLFADGLRYDLGQRLGERLEARGYRVTVGHRWAAAPTVTATAKPAVTPVADIVSGDTLEEDFGARLDPSGKSANAPNLRAAMVARGYQILAAGELEVPMETPGHGWLETGEIDTLGHKLGSRLARQIDEELDRLSERITSLLDSGWKRIRVVTDHGWLLLPGGLPRVDLPKHLTASRWARCAVISGSSTPDVLRHPWHWNPSQSFALAPGIACFNKIEEYAHGGLSVQECLIPDILVEQGDKQAVRVSILSITWRSLRCFVEVTTNSRDITADLRLKSASGVSVAASAKPVEPDGSVSLVLAGDEHEEASLVLVLIDAAGTILAQKLTRVGVDS